MYKFILTIVSIALLTSCGKKKPAIYENDTDSKEWINQLNIRQVPEAHSGSSACVVDSAHPYSLGFSNRIENINSNKFKEVEFSYWIYAKTDHIKANTVFSIDFNGKSVDWSGRPVLIKELNKWMEVKEIYRLSEKAEPNNQFSAYVWNTTNGEFLIDDLKISFK